MLIGNRVETSAICLLLAIATIIIFWQVQYHDFVYYDDGVYVVENRHIQSGLSGEGVVWAFTTTEAGFWHPLTWLSLLLDRQLYGMNAGGYHWTNLLFHIINTILLFLVLSRMTKGVWQSAFVAALFAVHPLHVESVAWIAERKDVLSAFFWMLSMWAYLFYAERPGPQRYLLVLLTFILGLMAKPMLVTLPFVFLLLDYWPLGRFRHRQAGGCDGNVRPETGRATTGSEKGAGVFPLLLEKLPLLFLAAVFSIAVFATENRIGALPSLEMFPLKVRVANAFISYVAYMGKMIWPRDLAVFYPHPGMWPVWQVAAAVLLLAFITFTVIRGRRDYPYLAVGWFWYLGTLVPVIGIAQLGSQAMADRYTYVTIIGLFILIAWGVPDLLKRWRRRRVFIAISATAALLLLMICARIQVGYWENATTLFRHAITATDENFLAHNNLGAALARDGKLTEAIAHYHKALQLRPRYADAFFNLGAALADTGKFSEAMIYYREALKIKPNFKEVYNNMGIAFAFQGNIREAIRCFREALMIRPDYIAAQNNLKLALKADRLQENILKHEP